MRNLLRTYTTAVAGPEWERQDTGGTSDSARAALTEMYRVLSRQDPKAASAPVSGEFIGQLTVLASERNTRVLDAEPRIPSLLWSGLIFGGVVLITLMGFMRLDSTRGQCGCPARSRFYWGWCCSSSSAWITRSGWGSAPTQASDADRRDPGIRESACRATGICHRQEPHGGALLSPTDHHRFRHAAIVTLFAGDSLDAMRPGAHVTAHSASPADRDDRDQQRN